MFTFGRESYNEQMLQSRAMCSHLAPEEKSVSNVANGNLGTRGRFKKCGKIDKKWWKTGEGGRFFLAKRA
jgi:hypothetical protein